MSSVVTVGIREWWKKRRKRVRWLGCYDDGKGDNAMEKAGWRSPQR